MERHSLDEPTKRTTLDREDGFRGRVQPTSFLLFRLTGRVGGLFNRFTNGEFG